MSSAHDADDYFGPPIDTATLVPPARDRPTGQDRRRAANSMPCVFIAVAKHEGSAWIAADAVMITEIIYICSSRCYVAMIGGVATLAATYVFGIGTARAFSLVYRLSASDEQTIRLSASTTGAPLNAHFTEFAGTRWRAMKLPSQLVTMITGSETPAFIELEEKYVKACGVQARSVGDLSDVVPEIFLDEAKHIFVFIDTLIEPSNYCF